MLGPIAYLVVLAAISLASGAYVAIRLRRGVRRGLVLLHVGLAALVCVFGLGIPVGNFYSHGFDIPWWGFGSLGGACMLLSAVLALLVTHVVKREKHSGARR
jgi:hypothetical protein